jgi:hypothetical protein
MVDIHEERFPPETLCKSIVQPTRHTDRIVSAVIDENPSHHRRTESANPRSHGRDKTTVMTITQ